MAFVILIIREINFFAKCVIKGTKLNLSSTDSAGEIWRVDFQVAPEKEMLVIR